MASRQGANGPQRRPQRRAAAPQERPRLVEGRLYGVPTLAERERQHVEAGLRTGRVPMQPTPRRGMHAGRIERWWLRRKWGRRVRKAERILSKLGPVQQIDRFPVGQAERARIGTVVSRVNRKDGS